MTFKDMEVYEALHHDTFPDIKPLLTIQAYHINERLGLDWQQVEKYETKQMVRYSAPTSRTKSELPIW
ncbi:hypothetical protein TNCV_2192521 [Trichonephila clavipes]|nr:hypothetical protein TNCV_2192521 [Trichonephila clavipes]